jgi:hypothetical protein
MLWSQFSKFIFSDFNGWIGICEQCIHFIYGHMKQSAIPNCQQGYLLDEMRTAQHCLGLLWLTKWRNEHQWQTEQGLPSYLEALEPRH